MQMDAFVSHLKHIKSDPNPIESKLDPNRPVISSKDIPPAVLEGWMHRTESFRNKYGSGSPNPVIGKRVVLVDGFLMMDSERVMRELDFVVFLHSGYETLKGRRDARSYITLEGSWQDPPGYFDQIVFPAYEKYNARVLAKLTRGVGSETVNVDIVGEAGTAETVTVHAMDTGMVGIAKMIEDAVDVVVKEIEI
ncbi:ribosylnicotinamide kinase [Podochytrium sp. JEL0797]|nr:ribosylnicotinamide kinase [Podochytrium sp. JEL0797]